MVLLIQNQVFLLRVTAVGARRAIGTHGTVERSLSRAKATRTISHAIARRFPTALDVDEGKTELTANVVEFDGSNDFPASES